jgi:IPT/TIG domain
MSDAWKITTGRARGLRRVVVVLAVLGVVAGVVSVGGPLASAASAKARRPVVTGVSPNAGATGETLIARIIGERFTKHSIVTFGIAKYRASHVQVLSSTVIFAWVPVHPAGNVYVHVTTANGTSASAVRNRYRYVRKPAVLDSGKPASVMPAIPDISKLSCPTSTFCMGADGVDVVRTDGSTLGTAVSVGFDAHNVSCASPQLCVASGGDDVSVYNGTSWGPPTRLTTHSDLAAASCAPDGYCVVAAKGNAYVWHGSGWTTQTVGTAAANPRLIAVSCVSASFCLAGQATNESHGNTGHTYRFDGTSWTDLGALFYKAPFDQDDLNDLSCASVTFCVAVGRDGEGAVFHGTAWATPTHGYPSSFPRVSCAAGPICVVLGSPAVRDGPNTMVSTGHGWSHANLAAADVAPGEPPVACTSPTLCRAVITDGWAYGFDGTSWSTERTRVARPRGHIVGLSCPSATFCAAIDHNGWVSTYNGHRWTDPRVLDADASLIALSCATATSCIAIDDQDNAFRYQGTTWSAPTKIDSSGALIAVSCATASWCFAVDDNGNAVLYSGSRWHAPHQVLVDSPFTAVSCPSTEFCMAVSSDGRTVRYAHGGWQHPHWTNGNSSAGGPGYTGSDNYFAVSCSSATYCIAGAPGGQQFFTGTEWSGGTEGQTRLTTGHQNVHSVSCITESFCGAIAYQEGDGSFGRRNGVLSMNGGNFRQQKGPYHPSLISCWAVNRCMADAAIGSIYPDSAFALT